MPPLNGKHVLLGLVGFFGTMLLANAMLVYLATSTYSGVSTRDAYLKGLHYNTALSEYRAQQRLRWQAYVTAEGGEIRIRVQQADRAPVDGLNFVGTLGRPATAAEDRPLTFRGAGGGLYIANTGTLAPGAWQLAADATGQPEIDATPFKVTARLWLKQ